MKNKILRQNFSNDLKKVETQLGPWSKKSNWIETLRAHLGMTLKQLGKRLGVSAVAVKQVSEKEKLGEVTLKKMSEYAEALGCRFYYFLAPKEDLEIFIERKARQLAYRFPRACPGESI